MSGEFLFQFELASSQELKVKGKGKIIPTPIPDGADFLQGDEDYENPENNSTEEEENGDIENVADDAENEGEGDGNDDHQEEEEEEDDDISHAAPEPVPLSTTIGLDSFEILKVVGKGGYGKVHQVRMKETGEIFAMKALKKRYLIKTKCVEHTRAERDILKKIRHPFVVGLHYAFQTGERLYLVMDFINGGHLLYHLRREVMFSDEQAQFYVAELVLALEHLHSQGIAHRDLKPENILLDSDGHVVLTDFGFAKENLSSDSGADSFCGTLEYMAPEMITGEGYGIAADWWSLGILVFDMLVGHPPFQSKSDRVLQNKILKEEIKFPRYVSNAAKSLIKGLTDRDVTKRLGSNSKGVRGLKCHHFFEKLSWKKMILKEIDPPYRPPVRRGKMDVSQFDDQFLKLPISDSPASPLSSSLQDKFKGFSYRRSPVMG